MGQEGASWRISDDTHKVHVRFQPGLAGYVYEFTALLFLLPRNAGREWCPNSIPIVRVRTLAGGVTHENYSEPERNGAKKWPAKLGVNGVLALQQETNLLLNRPSLLYKKAPSASSEIPEGPDLTKRIRGSITSRTLVTELLHPSVADRDKIGTWERPVSATIFQDIFNLFVTNCMLGAINGCLSRASSLVTGIDIHGSQKQECLH